MSSLSDFSQRQMDFFFNEVVPKKYRLASLDTCDKQPAALIDFGRQWAKNPHSLYLYGNAGSGKTHFCFSLIREMYKKSEFIRWPRFYTSPSLDSELHAAVLNGGDSQLIKKVCESDLLILDDFGRETKSERIRRQYFEIINYRYSNEMVTIITSNFGLDYISQEIGDVVSSRIEEWKLIKFTGKDLRKQELII